MPVSHDNLMQLGDWCVDPSLNEIRRADRTVKLEPRAMQLLACLANHPGEVVTVDQLLDTVWKDVVVTPDSVYQAVALLRKALGDDPKKPVYIANVIRRGYRLIAPVTPWVESKSGHGPGPIIIGPAEVLAPAPTTSSRETLSRPRWHWVALAIALIAGGAFVAGSYVRRNDSRTESLTDPQIRAQSVAVLPFADMSDTKNQQYFADGLTEELIERLASIPRLHVAARSSSSYFGGTHAPITEIARRLGVSYLLEGSVRKAGNGMRITAHMVRGEDGDDLWSETYDRPFSDIFKIQDEIASAVVQVLKISVVAPETNLTLNSQAYTQFLRALAHVDKGMDSDYEAAEMQLHAALALDPHYAGAWALLATSTIWRFDVRAPNPTPGACAIAHSAAELALRFGPMLPQAHRAQGIVLQSCDGNLESARMEFDRALQLQPDDPLLLLSQARLAAEMGQSDRSIEYARHATSVDSLNPWTFSALGDVYLFSGHPAEAESAYRRAIQINSSLAYNHSALAIALLTNHELAEAVAQSEIEPDPQYRLRVWPITLDAAGRKVDAEQKLLELRQRYGVESADWIALFYACRHDGNNAMPWLRAYLARHLRVSRYQPYLMECLNSLRLDALNPGVRHQLETSGGNWPRSRSSTE
jgi:transcriptional activator of cad operon